MIAGVIRWSARNILLILIATAAIVAGGLLAVGRLSLDAIPDLSDTQVIVYTEMPGQAPQVVEDQGVGEVGDGVERKTPHGKHAARHDGRRCDQDQQQIARRPANDAGDHLPSPLLSGWPKAASAARILLSASIRKVACVTTRSPALTPSSTCTQPGTCAPSFTGRGS